MIGKFYASTSMLEILGEDTIILPYKTGGIMTKQCNKCKKIKLIIEYYNHSTSKDKKAYDCKSCAYIAKKQWNKDNPKKYKAQIARRKHSPNWPDSQSRKNKINKQREHRKNLSDSYIIQLIISKGTIGQNLTPEDIPDKLIESTRLNIQLKRILKKTAKLKPPT